jgi:nucleosome binding factor SPN SPT16 subunit
MPTVHCLVALDDVPPMVVTLADVEVAIFERVQFNLRNFDLVFILKGLEQTVQVQAIPSKHFDSIKQWLK